MTDTQRQLARTRAYLENASLQKRRWFDIMDKYWKDYFAHIIRETERIIRERERRKVDKVRG
jgi:hypothetical protein